MNPFFNENTTKEAVLDISQVKRINISDLFLTGQSLITVHDKQYENVYQIKIEKILVCGRVQHSGMCFLDKYPSYQADFIGDRKLSDVINKIAGMCILNDDGHENAV